MTMITIATQHTRTTTSPGTNLLASNMSLLPPPKDEPTPTIAKTRAMMFSSKNVSRGTGGVHSNNSPMIDRGSWYHAGWKAIVDATRVNAWPRQSVQDPPFARNFAFSLRSLSSCLWSVASQAFISLVACNTNSASSTFCEWKILCFTSSISFVSPSSCARWAAALTASSRMCFRRRGSGRPNRSKARTFSYETKAEGSTGAAARNGRCRFRGFSRNKSLSRTASGTTIIVIRMTMGSIVRNEKQMNWTVL